MAESERKDVKLHRKIKPLIDSLISSASDFSGSGRKSRRELSLEYQAGRMPDLEYDEGRSSVVEMTVSDTIAMLKPSLGRVFFSSDQIARFEPVAPSSLASMPGNTPEEKR